MKAVLQLMLIVMGLAVSSTSSAANWNKPEQFGGSEYRDFPVHEYALSNLRKLVIPDGYKFFVSGEALDAFHAEYKYPLRKLKPYRNTLDYIDQCAAAIASFDLSFLDPTPMRFFKCKQWLARIHFYDRRAGVDALAQILKSWAVNKPVVYKAKNRNQEDHQAYAASMLVSDFASHYAVYYDDFPFNEEERKSVDQYLAEWITNHDLAPESGRLRCELENLSVFTRPGNKYDTDYCGSNRWRIGIAGVFLGLRLRDQELFEAGNRHVEINLATIDADGIFVHWARKGGKALSYTRQLPETLTLLATAYASLGYDFYDHQTPHGRKISEVYAKIFEIIDSPDQLNKYAAATPNFGGRDLREFNRLPLNEKWRIEYIDPANLAADASGYVKRYRPDLETLAIYKGHWAEKWPEHVAMWTNLSAIAVYESANEFDKRIAIERRRAAQEFGSKLTAQAERIRADEIKKRDEEKERALELQAKKRLKQLDLSRLLSRPSGDLNPSFDEKNTRRFIFVPSRPKKIKPTNGNEIVKAYIEGSLVFDGTEISDIITESNVGLTSTVSQFSALFSIMEVDAREVIGILPSEQMSAVFGNVPKVAREKCGRIAKPPEWLVFPVTPEESGIDKISACYAEVVFNHSDNAKSLYGLILFTLPSIREYLLSD
jgi:hypothetical protein